MALAVGMVSLRHQIGKLPALVNVVLKLSQAVHQADVVFARQPADKVRMLVQGIFWVVQFGR